jgi:hypothetical protein
MNHDISIGTLPLLAQIIKRVFRQPALPGDAHCTKNTQAPMKSIRVVHQFRDIRYKASIFSSWCAFDQSLYPILRRNSFRCVLSTGVSTPLGEKPSITPSMPLAWGDAATTTSSGFAVAQKMRQTSGQFLIGRSEIDAEHMTRTNGLERFHAGIDEFLIVPFRADETGTRRLGKGNAELRLRDGRGDDLIQVFCGLDEVGLTEDDIAAFRNINFYDMHVHMRLRSD